MLTGKQGGGEGKGEGGGEGDGGGGEGEGGGGEGEGGGGEGGGGNGGGGEGEQEVYEVEVSQELSVIESTLGPDSPNEVSRMVLFPASKAIV